MIIKTLCRSSLDVLLVLMEFWQVDISAEPSRCLTLVRVSATVAPAHLLVRSWTLVHRETFFRKSAPAVDSSEMTTSLQKNVDFPFSRYFCVLHCARLWFVPT